MGTVHRKREQEQSNFLRTVLDLHLQDQVFCQGQALFYKNQENNSENNKSLFFRNQKELKDLRVQKDMNEALKGIDVLVFAVRHEQYLNRDPCEIVKTIGKRVAVIDCFGILSDGDIRRYLGVGCEVKGLGRGHIRRLKEVMKKAGGV